MELNLFFFFIYRQKLKPHLPTLFLPNSLKKSEGTNRRTKLTFYLNSFKQNKHVVWLSWNLANTALGMARSIKKQIDAAHLHGNEVIH